MALIFAKRQADGTYHAPLIHRLLAPNISGNVINGLGELDRRKPTRMALS